MTKRLKTVRTYTNEFKRFLYTIRNKFAADFSVSRLKDYLEYHHKTLYLSENTLHSSMNSLKFCYEQVLKGEKFFWEIPWPKRPLLLPKLLNETEIRNTERRGDTQFATQFCHTFA